MVKMDQHEAKIKVSRLKNKLREHVTNGIWNEEEYQQIRQFLVHDPSLSKFIPTFIHSCKTLSECKQSIWDEFGKVEGRYDLRRQYINDEFKRIEEYLTSQPISPVDDGGLEEICGQLNFPKIIDIWERGRVRMSDDPGGALTMARTLLETVCKHILDELDEEYTNTDDLNDLYRKVISGLDLGPSKDLSREFEKLFGATQSIIISLGTIRNELGDAHGKGIDWEDPLTVHAELALNFSGSMSMFLMKNYEIYKARDT